MDSVTQLALGSTVAIATLGRRTAVWKAALWGGIAGTLPDLDAVPEPYLLSRGVDAPGDFSTAELGNFLVRERARRVLEISASGACRFYPTLAAKSRV